MKNVHICVGRLVNYVISHSSGGERTHNIRIGGFAVFISNAHYEICHTLYFVVAESTKQIYASGSQNGAYKRKYLQKINGNALQMLAN